MIIYYAVNYWYTRQLQSSGLKLIAPAVEEPITLAEAAGHLRLDAVGSPAEYIDQEQIEPTLAAARELCEGLSGLALAPQVFELGMSNFPACDLLNQDNAIPLRVAPLLGLLTFEYDDADGNLVTLVEGVDYLIDTYRRPAVVYPPTAGGAWPASNGKPGSVRLRFNAGYNLPGDSPQDAPLPLSLRHAILLTLGHLWENREASSSEQMYEIPFGVRALLERYRVRLGIA